MVEMIVKVEMSFMIRFGIKVRVSIPTGNSIGSGLGLILFWKLVLEDLCGSFGFEMMVEIIVKLGLDHRFVSI